MNEKHELLAPGGNCEIAKAVLNAGADAVYIGGEKFGARAYAQNLNQKEISELLDWAHLRGKKLYLTINTLLKNTEIAELYDYVLPFYERGLDGVIVQDFGVLSFLKRNFPDLPLHASTQMSVASPYGAEFIIGRGASRVVTARELSTDEIKNIYDKTGAQLECFIHGALCFSYSGQCMMSSFIGERSGNRGRCAQPCRLAYKGADSGRAAPYILSMKDLCAIELLPALCGAGVYSFKIEGRMKSLSYAAGVTGIYRKYLDLYESGAPYVVEPSDMEALLSMGNRGGFTRGYFESRGGREMMSLEDSSFKSDADAAPVFEDKRLPADAKVVAKEKMPLSLTLTCGGFGVTAEGGAAERAKSRPISVSDIEAHIGKLGDTPFYLKDLSAELDDNIFVPVGALNALRRDAVKKLEDALLKKFRRHAKKPAFKAETSAVCERASRGLGSLERRRAETLPRQKSALTPDIKQPFLHAVITNEAQLEAALECENVRVVSLDAVKGDALSMIKKIHAAGRRAGYCFPYVLRHGLSGDALSGYDFFIVRSYDGLGFSKAAKIAEDRIILDDRLYVFSNEAKRAFADAGYTKTTASFELNAGELSHMDNAGAELMVYGYQPAMITAQCVRKNSGFSCLKNLKAADSLSSKRGNNALLSGTYENNFPAAQGKSSRIFFIKDRKGELLPVRLICDGCMNIIYNPLPLSLIGCAKEAAGGGFSSFRAAFLNESPEEIRAVLNACSDAFIKRIPVPDIPGIKYTRGHFHRGVL